MSEHHSGTKYFLEINQKRLMKPTYAMPRSRMSDPHLNEVLTKPRMVGRHAESVDISRLLGAGTRLLVVTGPAGVGKSRLALEAACSMRELFEGGVEIFDRAQESGSEEAAEKLARLTECVRSTTAPDGVQPRRLLVVDNHVPGDEPLREQLRRSLAHDPSLSILLTSREAIGWYGEKLYELHPLPLPSPAAEVERFLTSPSVQLLMGRSDGYLGDLERHGPARLAVLDLVTALDGLPLAIELAAPWLKALSPEALRERLRFSLEMLSARSAGVVSLRHSSMSEALAESYYTLPPEARSTLVQLSHHDEFTFEDVHRIIGGDPSANDRTLRLLVENHLLRVHQGGLGNPRLSLLNTTRIFAQETERADRSAGPLRERTPVNERVYPLTPRQRQVAGLIADGLTNREISKSLNIAEWTVINHVREVMRRLGCSSRVQVASWFAVHGRPREPLSPGTTPDSWRSEPATRSSIP